MPLEGPRVLPGGSWRPPGHPWGGPYLKYTIKTNCFLMILKSTLCTPVGALGLPKDPPRTPQAAPGSSQGPPGSPQGGPREPLGTSKSAPFAYTYSKYENTSRQQHLKISSVWGHVCKVHKSAKITAKHKTTKSAPFAYTYVKYA